MASPFLAAARVFPRWVSCGGSPRLQRHDRREPETHADQAASALALVTAEASYEGIEQPYSTGHARDPQLRPVDNNQSLCPGVQIGCQQRPLSLLRGNDVVAPCHP